MNASACACFWSAVPAPPSTHTVSRLPPAAAPRSHGGRQTGVGSRVLEEVRVGERVHERGARRNWHWLHKIRALPRHALSCALREEEAGQEEDVGWKGVILDREGRREGDREGERQGRRERDREGGRQGRSREEGASHVALEVLLERHLVAARAAVHTNPTPLSPRASDSRLISTRTARHPALSPRHKAAAPQAPPHHPKRAPSSHPHHPHCIWPTFIFAFLRSSLALPSISEFPLVSAILLVCCPGPLAPSLPPSLPRSLLPVSLSLALTCPPRGRRWPAASAAAAPRLPAATRGLRRPAVLHRVRSGGARGLRK
eukprot:2170052-Rhodomonas_salina.3